MQIEMLKISELVPYDKNPRINKNAVDAVANSLREFGFKQPLVIDDNNVLVCGHTRLKAAKKLKIKEVPCVRASDLSEEQIKAYRIADNSTAALAEWDMDLLAVEVGEIEMDLTQFGLEPLQDAEELPEVVEDEAPEVDESTPPVSQLGDIWELGRHRLMCGDSTDAGSVALLMGGVKADMVFTDPPYGMKKEKDGILNDNLNYDDLLEFNKKWIPITFDFLDDVGSWYCWGIDEPLMDIYSHILKPMARNNEITFRNLLTWDKGNGQGQLAEEFRMYPVADEKCLFVMKGVQGFNTNADNYFEAWEPIREYLKKSKDEMGWDIPKTKKIAGHSIKSGCHWFDKCQWMLPTEDVYISWQNAVFEQEEKDKKEYSAFKKEYDEIKKEYDEIKKEYYATRAYFDNTHDNMNNVWHFKRTGSEERALTGGHASPKPLDLCSRAIKSSSKLDGSVLDLFGGSGSTLIACEQLNRTCYMMELDPKYMDVILKRYQNLTGIEPTLNGKTFTEVQHERQTT